VTHVSIFGGRNVTLPHGWSRETVVCILGGADIDAQAAPSGDGVIRVFTFLGGATLKVSRAARVNVGGFALLGGRGADVGPGEPDGPSLSVTGASILGGVDVRRV
jgi:hypothetical protein